MYQHFLDILDQFGAGGSSGPENLAVRFLLAAFFWLILAIVSGRHWHRQRSGRDLFIFLAASLGLVRELSMFAGEYGSWLGYFEFQHAFKFYPPFEHALTMLSGLLISFAFIKYFKALPGYEKIFLWTGGLVVVLLYLLIAPTWISYLAEHPETVFGSFWGDMAFRVAASLYLGTALLALLRTRRKHHVPINLLIGILFLFLDEFLMIFNLYSKEIHVQAFAPIRHNLHLWAIPFFIATYWNDLRRREIELRTRSEAIIAALGDGLSIQDRDFRVIFQNQVHRDLMGEQEGKYCYQVYRHQEEVCQDCPVARSFADGEIHHGLNHDPETGKYVEITASPLKDQKGNVVAAIELVRDISARRRMEVELEKTHKLETIGVLAGGIAHDFNNLLTGILGNVSLAKAVVGEEQGEANDAVVDYLASAEKASIRARDLTQQLLTFSKGGAPIKQAASIADLVRESASFAASGANVDLEIKVEDGLWNAEVDPGQFSQVIQNLVLNAVQSMADGGRILIELKNNLFETQASLPLQGDRYVLIKITDNGRGIPGQNMAKIFDPFFTTKEGGSGLGLSIVFSIIKKHEGHIAVESSESEGTSFSVYIPAADLDDLRKDGPEKGIYPGHGRILLMDDDEVVCEAAERMLGQAGYEVLISHDGKDALATYEKSLQNGELIDAVILDLTIPGGMGGRETIGRLMDIDPGVKAIVSSGYANDPVMADHQKSGFKDVLPKPYKMAELTYVLHKLLNL